MAELHIQTESGEQQTIELDGDTVTFGRGDECDVVLTEQRASRRHCTFHPCGAGWRVEDEQSSNGTWLGGRPVLSARLQSGDEIEIGKTVISYVGRSATTEPLRTRRRPAKKKTPWGLLAIPVVLGVGLAALSGLLRDQGEAAASESWKRYARATLARADRIADADERRRTIEALDAELADAPFAAAALRIVRAHDATAPVAGGGADPVVAAGDWRGALAGYDAAGEGLPLGRRQNQLSRLLDRHVDDPVASAEIRQRLLETVEQYEAAARGDLGRTQVDADAALEEGQLGRALDIWTAWRLRAPFVSKEVEKDVASRLADIRSQAAAEAKAAAAAHRRLTSEGKTEEAEAALDEALHRLRGTGFESWLLIRGGRVDRPSEVAIGKGGDPRGTASSRELARVLSTVAKADDLTRLRRYDDALQRLNAALSVATDEALRLEVTDRIESLTARNAALDHVIARIAKSPDSASPLKLKDGVFRVLGAGTAGLTIQHPRRDKAEFRALEALAGDELAGLFAKCGAERSHELGLALVLHDAGSAEGYTAWMRKALSVTDEGNPDENTTRLLASRAHARAAGLPLPPEGFVPHPSVDMQIITYEAREEIRNAEAIAGFRAKLQKIVDKVESSKQARSIEKVRAAYEKLEAARDHALELIFDTVKYFYPYRDRMDEYAPVSKEVDNRVDVVFAAWDAPVKVSPRKDAALAKLLEDAEELVVEIDYLSGESGDLTDRLDAVARYLDLDEPLTVRTFFVTARDKALLAYNKGVMEKNAAMDTIATDDEREQVRITNAYRIMFGHRRAVLIHDQLVDAARGHSKDMERLNFFSHFSPVPGKRGPGDRVKLAGYPLNGASENIHMGSSTPKGAHDGWRHSSGHHRNLLDPTWVELGTGRSGRYWTQNFGLRSGDFGDFE